MVFILATAVLQQDAECRNDVADYVCSVDNPEKFKTLSKNGHMFWYLRFSVIYVYQLLFNTVSSILQLKGIYWKEYTCSAKLTTFPKTRKYILIYCFHFQFYTKSGGCEGSKLFPNICGWIDPNTFQPCSEVRISKIL